MKFLPGRKAHDEPEASRRDDDRQSTERQERATPDIEDPRKPDGPREMTKPSWVYVVRKTAREFSEDQCTDLAAALTYYAVLAIFPATIALLSVLGLVGQSRQAIDTGLGVLSDVGAGSVADTIRPTLLELSQSSGAGIALVVGLAGALWSASGYVGAFSRASNRVYEIGEGRPIWKLRPAMLLVTVVLVVLAAVALLLLALTGPVAQAVGDQIGLGSAAVLTWQIAKWPVLLLVVVTMVALLFWATPNVKQPKFRWLSVGAVLAIVVWALASAAFGVYVAMFSSYNQTYGALAGVVVFLLWLWITNLALLFGAELDAEIERGRQLQAGFPAEEEIQLPARDTKAIDKAEAKRADDVRRGRELRRSHGRPDDAEPPRGRQKVADRE
ncbi:YihY/virulence factor BrkB family protein [Solicola sp. PLA-1-18]|uniref:YihY/virulence factor BrkB family protein n=1 Tax=Solicola sp. PLA-1-18 TaxID=3380532 RepID=UPI003B80D25A